MENKLVCALKQTDYAGGFPGNTTPKTEAAAASLYAAAAEEFYEKLRKLHESSGLCLVFNFRETILDLHLFYQEVIKRGGFNQVTEDGKWDEIASELNLKSFGTTSLDQLQKVYSTLLLEFEQKYSIYRPKKSITWAGPLGSGVLDPSLATKKRKLSDILSPSQIASGNPETRKSNDGCDRMDLNSPLTTSSTSKDKEFGKAPLKPRTGYQIFLRQECHKLKSMHGEDCSTKNLLHMAIDKWRHLSDEAKKPYIEASYLDKMRYGREMAAFYEKENNGNAGCHSSFARPTPETVNFSPTAETGDDDYRVSLENDSENVLSPNESVVELASELVRNAEPNDPMFQIDFDSAGYLDLAD